MPKLDLYFFRMEVAERPIKIGRSVATKKRLDILQCGSPYRLSVVGLVYGEGEWEEVWHRHFAEDRMLGEWFKASDRLERAIADAMEHGSRKALGLPEPEDWRARLGLGVSA